MTRVKQQKTLLKVAGKSGNSMAITHFPQRIGVHSLSFIHRPIINRDSLFYG